MLGDVHVAHDLDTGDDSALGVAGHGEDMAQDAVDTHADGHGGFTGLQVDIGNVLVDSILQEAVDQTDGGCGILGIGADDVGGGDVLEVGGLGGFIVLQVLQGLFGGLGAVGVVDGPGEGLGSGQHGHDLLAGGHVDGLGGDEVQGVGHGQEQHIAVGLDGDHIILLGQGAGDQLGHLLGDLHTQQVDKFHAQLALQCLVDLALGGEALLDEDLAQLFAGGLALDLQSLIQLFFIDGFNGEKHVAETFIDHGKPPQYGQKHGLCRTGLGRSGHNRT